MLRATLAFAAALLLPLSGEAAPTPEESEKNFEQLLRLIDTPVDRATLAETVPDAKTRLLAVATDVKRPEYARLRAVSLLGQFPEADVRATFETLAKDPVEGVRGEALLWLGRAFGRPGDASLVAAVAAGLEDASSLVKDRAVRALRWVAFPSAGTLLESIAKSNPNAELRRLARVTSERRASLLASGAPNVAPAVSR